MNVFDPGAGFNAFAAGAQIGGNIRKSQTQRAMAPMLANNDYEGAMKYVAGRGDLEAMDYIRPMQEKAAAEAYNKELGGLLASGNRQGAMQNAFAAGKLDLATNIYNLDRTMKQGEQEDYRAAIKYLVDGSAEIMALPEDDPRRGERAMQLASTSAYKDNPQFMQAVQRAVADGRLTDREINEFRNNLMSIEAQVAQQNWQTQYDTGREDRAADLEYRASQAAEDARRFDLTHGLQREQFNWDREPAVPEFGDTWRMRTDFEKQARLFEEAQRQYFMMGNLAEDSTGASDIALGFAFFKTIDPTSTVREGEFAAAAGAMGLNAALVQQFARLDKGEKFSPQLRQDLLQAAGHAYAQQAQDIEAMYEREAAFAASMGVDPSLVVRNPVRPVVAPVNGVSLPEAGAEEDGYVFLGGDPADPNSWKLKQQGDDFRFFSTGGDR